MWILNDYEFLINEYLYNWNNYVYIYEYKNIKCILKIISNKFFMWI